MRAFIIGIAVIALTGCATKATQPDWVTGESDNYQRTEFLLGRGQASTQEEAKDRARADIAKVFQVAVTVASEDMQRFKTQTKNDQAASDGAQEDGNPNQNGQYENQYSRRITTRTEQVIRGIQIAELWHDPATHNHHVLAILPRLQAVNNLRQEINELDEITRRHISHAQNHTDLFLKIASASLALASQHAREAVQKSLQVVDRTGQGVATTLSSGQLQASLGELLRRVKLASLTAADAPPGLAEIVAGALAHAGYLLEDQKQAEFIVRAQLNLTDLGLQEGWYWQRGHLEITLSEAASGRVRGTQRWLIKSSAPDKNGAAKRAMNQVDTVLKLEMGAAIIAMATGNSNPQ